MAPQVGGKVWIPCEVKPGPFSNERLARIQLAAGPWVVAMYLMSTNLKGVSSMKIHRDRATGWR